MDTLDFYGQPIFKLSSLEESAIGYELKLYPRDKKQWLLEEQPINLPVEQFERLVIKTINAIPNRVSLISFDLTYEQFVNLRFRTMIATLQTELSVRLVPELTEHPRSPIRGSAVVSAIEALFNADVAVCVANVGSGNQIPGLVEALTPYVLGYKFSVQAAAGLGRNLDLMDRFSFWKNKAAANHKRFDVTGVESLDDVIYLKEQQACDLVQGPYFSHALAITR